MCSLQGENRSRRNGGRNDSNFVLTAEQVNEKQNIMCQIDIAIDFSLKHESVLPRRRSWLFLTGILTGLDL